MGQQQLVLILLGVIVVSVSIAAGINIYNANLVDRNREQLVSHLYEIINLAKMYYEKPVSQGGGGKSFNRFNRTIPNSMLNTSFGTFVININAQRVRVRGDGIELSRNGQPIRYTLDLFTDGTMLLRTVR